MLNKVEHLVRAAACSELLAGRAAAMHNDGTD